MMTKRTMTIGVTLPDLTNPFFPSLVRGIQAEARRSGYTVTLVETDWQAANEKQAVEILRRQSVDGIILVDASLVEFLTHTLLEAHIPLVLLNKGVERQAVAQVTVNNYKGATDAMEWMFSRGHRRIAFLPAPPHLAPSNHRFPPNPAP